MTEHDNNKLFDFFKDEHDLLLTGKEIDEIVKKITKKDDNHYQRAMQYKINMYRLINIVILFCLNILLPEKGMTYVVWLFIAYNVIHLFINIIKDKMDALKEYRMAKKQ